MKRFAMPLLVIAVMLVAAPLFAQEPATEPPAIDPNLVMILAGAGAYLATIVIKHLFPRLPSVLVPWIITPLLGLIGGWVTTLMGGELFWQVALGTLLSSFANGLASNTSKAVKEASIGKTLTTVGEAAKSAPFWVLIIVGSSLLSPMVAQAQTWETRTLFEPDYTVGLVSVKNKVDGDGIRADLTPGIGIGVAYSQVGSSDGENWDITEWSVAVNPLYIERDETGALFWVPGIKGSVFNEYLQVYLGYKVGSLSTEASRWEVKFGTSITGIWNGLSGAVGIE